MTVVDTDYDTFAFIYLQEQDVDSDQRGKFSQLVSYHKYRK